MIPDAIPDENETFGCVSVKQISSDNMEIEQISDADVNIQSEATVPRPIIIFVINKPACGHLPCNYRNCVNVCDELARDTSNQREQKAHEEDTPGVVHHEDALEVVLDNNVEHESDLQDESKTTDNRKTNKSYVHLDPASRERPRKAPVYIRLTHMNSQ